MCDHPEFDAFVQVDRQVHNGDTPVSWTAVVQLRCRVCAMQFGFLQAAPYMENNTALRVQVHPAYGAQEAPPKLDLNNM